MHIYLGEIGVVTSVYICERREFSLLTTTDPVRRDFARGVRGYYLAGEEFPAGSGCRGQLDFLELPLLRGVSQSSRQWGIHFRDAAPRVCAVPLVVPRP